MFANHNSFSNSNSFSIAAADDPKVRSLPLVFRYAIPGFEGGWPAR